jgi:hypothetical protein
LDHRTVQLDLGRLRPTWKAPIGNRTSHGGIGNADAHGEDPFGLIDEPTAKESKRRRGRRCKN